MEFKTRNFLVIFSFILLAGLASASSITCTVVDVDVLVEIDLDEAGIVSLPEKYSVLESDSEYEIVDGKLFSNGGIIKFISSGYFRGSGHEYIFIFPKIIDVTSSIKIYLPENHILSDNLVYPKNYSISTNGRNIILEWNEIDDEVIIFYEGVPDSNLLLYLFSGLLFIVASVVVYFQHKKFKKRLQQIKNKQKEKIKKVKTSKKDLITKNLFDDEKKIIEYLVAKKGHTCWTKELVKELDISKVRLSRKIRSLAEKGLIEKESHGNANRINLN